VPHHKSAAILPQMHCKHLLINDFSTVYMTQIAVKSYLQHFDFKQVQSTKQTTMRS